MHISLGTAKLHHRFSSERKTNQLFLNTLQRPGYRVIGSTFPDTTAVINENSTIGIVLTIEPTTKCQNRGEILSQV